MLPSRKCSNKASAKCKTSIYILTKICLTPESFSGLSLCGLCLFRKKNIIRFWPSKQHLKPKYALFYPLSHCERPLAIALSFPLVKVQSKQKNFNALAKYPQTTKISITGFSTIFLYCQSELKSERKIEIK